MKASDEFVKSHIARAVVMAGQSAVYPTTVLANLRMPLSKAFANLTDQTLQWLRLVHKSPLAVPVQLAQNIALADSVQMAIWHKADAPTEIQCQTALAILRNACQGKFWIACGCRSSEPELFNYPPIIVPVDLGDDNYTLRRLGGRPAHDPHCLFRLDTHKIDDVSPQSKVNLGPPKAPPDLLHGHPIGEGRVHQPGKVTRQVKDAFSRSGSNTLFASLRHLMSVAGLNQVRPTRTYAGELVAIQGAASQIFHKKNKQLTLDSCMLVDPPDPDAPDILYMLFAMSQGLWPEDELPVGYVLLLADAIEKQDDGQCTIKTTRMVERSQTGGLRARPVDKRTTFNPGCKIRVTEIQGRVVAGPYLVLLRAEKNYEGAPVWIEGFAHPIASADCWLPVRSEPERDAFEVLRQFTSELQKMGVQYNIHGVLKPLCNAEGQCCEPDFFAERLETGQPTRPLLIETQSTNDPKYHARKLKQHNIMRGIGELHVDERLTVTRTEADQRLFARLCEHFKLKGGLP